MAFDDTGSDGCAQAARPGILALEPDRMRALGYQAVDALVEHYSRLDARPVVDWHEPGATLADLPRGFPEAPQDPGAALALALEQVFGHGMQVTHPRFFAYIPSPGNFVSALGDFLASGFNVFAGVAPHNLGPYEAEMEVIRWLAALVGFGDDAGGLLVSGGSVASLTALTVARHRLLGDDRRSAVAYCTTQTHSCIERALFILGFAPEQLRVLEADADLRLEPARLQAAIAADRAAGRRPFCVVGSGGTTNTGAVDPLDAIASICEREGLWFHVDAAYGGGALLSARARARFTGIERAHSVALDPHKWLFQPFECGCVLVRDPHWLYQTFRRMPEYMRDSDASAGMYNFRDMGPQVTRGFRAFKLWLSLRVFGVGAFRRAVDRGLELAERAEALLRERACWEVVTPATLGVVTFRYRSDALDGPGHDRLTGALVEGITRSGFAYLSSTQLFDRRVIRLCPIHPECTERDLSETLDRLERLAGRLLEGEGV